IVTGPVTIGNGTANKAIFAPGVNGVGLFTIQNSLTFAANGSYNWSFEPETVTADEISATGITITAGAQFSAVSHRGAKLPVGTIFTVIDNTSGLPVEGTFVNLADEAIITVDGNSFQASYEGGDGNDLVLTVVP